MKRSFTIEGAPGGFVHVRVPPSGAYLIDGKTGQPARFNRSDVDVSAKDTELYRVLKALTLMEADDA